MRSSTRFLSLAVVLLALVVVLLWQRNGRLSQQRDRYRGNTEALLSDMRRMQVDSSTMALDVKALRLSADEYERYRAEDMAKIKAMGVRIRSLEAAARHELAVDVPLDVPVRDSVIIRDTVAVSVKTVTLQNPHISLQGVIENNRLCGNIHLPVTLRQAVWIEYKRRWLFWKRVKAIHQTISSDNPYVEITYSEYINILK